MDEQLLVVLLDGNDGTALSNVVKQLLDLGLHLQVTSHILSVVNIVSTLTPTPTAY